MKTNILSQSGPESNGNKGYSTFHRGLEVEPYHPVPFCVIPRTLILSREPNLGVDNALSIFSALSTKPQNFNLLFSNTFIHRDI